MVVLSHLPTEGTSETAIALTTQLRDKVFPAHSAKLETGSLEMELSKRLALSLSRAGRKELVEAGLESLLPMDWLYLLQDLGLPDTTCQLILQKMDQLPPGRLTETLSRSTDATRNVASLLNATHTPYPNLLKALQEVRQTLPSPVTPITDLTPMVIDDTPPPVPFQSIQASLHCIFGQDQNSQERVFDELIRRLLCSTSPDQASEVSETIRSLSPDPSQVARILRARPRYSLSILSWLRQYLPDAARQYMQLMGSLHSASTQATLSLDTFWDSIKEIPAEMEGILHRHLHQGAPLSKPILQLLRSREALSAPTGVLGMILDVLWSMHASFDAGDAAEWGEVLGITSSNLASANLGASLRGSILHGSWRTLGRFGDWLLSLKYADIRPVEWMQWVTALLATDPLSGQPPSASFHARLFAVPLTSINTLVQAALATMDTRGWDAPLDVMVEAISLSEEHLRETVLLLNRLSQHSQSSPAALLLSGIYMKFPTVVSTLTHRSDISVTHTQQSSEMDATLHAGVRALMDPSGSVCIHGYQLLRGISLHHPDLLLRYVPVLASLLEGRGHVSTTEFLERQYPRLFLHVLALLDSLRPRIFDAEGLRSMMESYLVVLSSLTSAERELVPLVSKFINFMCFYAVADPHSLVFGPQLREVLRHLNQLFPEVKKIQFLEQILGRHLVESELTGTISFPPKELAEIQAHLRQGARSQDTLHVLLKTLRDLDQASLRTAALLQYFLNDLFGVGQIVESLNCCSWYAVRMPSFM